MQQKNADILFVCKKQKRRYASLIPILFVLRTITVFIMMRKKGYSGVAIYCKKQPDKIISGTSWLDADAEGRFIEAQFGNLSVISLYSPSGSSSEERQTIKFKFMDRFMPYLQACTKKGRNYIILPRLEYRPQRNRLKNLAWKSIELGFFARRKGLARSIICKWTLAGCVQNDQTGSRAKHLVVK